MFSISYKSDCLSLQSEVSVHLKLGASDVSELKRLKGRAVFVFESLHIQYQIYRILRMRLRINIHLKISN